ncbi:hypothetical protein, partial [Kistimonas scapharcae]|uniref:hypothetical protein n=1 Tax=Kistimonas scapharcae TaxID=1036133 RepID=UPI0031ED0D99
MPRHGDPDTIGLTSQFSGLSLSARTRPTIRSPQQYTLSAEDNERLGQGYIRLKNNPEQSQKIADELLVSHSNTCRDYIRIVDLKARACLALGRYDVCLTVLNPIDLTNKKGLLLTKGRALQGLGNMNGAFELFKTLYDHHSTNDKDQKSHGLALGRQYQDMGQHAPALAIFLNLRKGRS